MEKFKKRKASALLTVIVMTSLITIFTISWWKRLSIAYDIQLTREEYYKKFYLTDYILFQGIKLVKKRFYPQILDLTSIAKKINSSNNSIKKATLIVKKARKKDVNEFLQITAQTSFFTEKFTLKVILVRRCVYDPEAKKEKTVFYVRNYKIV